MPLTKGGNKRKNKGKGKNADEQAEPNPKALRKGPESQVPKVQKLAKAKVCRVSARCRGPSCSAMGPAKRRPVSPFATILP